MLLTSQDLKLAGLSNVKTQYFRYLLFTEPSTHRTHYLQVPILKTPSNQRTLYSASGTHKTKYSYDPGLTCPSNPSIQYSQDSVITGLSSHRTQCLLAPLFLIYLCFQKTEQRMIEMPYLNKLSSYYVINFVYMLNTQHTYFFQSTALIMNIILMQLCWSEVLP